MSPLLRMSVDDGGECQLIGLGRHGEVTQRVSGGYRDREGAMGRRVGGRRGPERHHQCADPSPDGRGETDDPERPTTGGHPVLR